MKKNAYYILILLYFLSSCRKGYLDINTDPNNPTQITVQKLLPNAELSVANSFDIGGGNQGGLSNTLAVYMHQIVQREDPFDYGATGDDFFLNDAWTRIYSADVDLQTAISKHGVLQNLEVIISQATAADNKIYSGIAKILKAYAYSQFVDAFADIPFSEAEKFNEGISYPKFDKGEDIYPALFSLLDEGIADMQADAANNLRPGTDDVIYNGDVTKWIKAANTIKLKLFAQERLVQDVSQPVQALLSGGNLIGTTSESFLLPYGFSVTPDDRNIGFNDYIATQRTNYISPWFYEILKGYNPKILTNIQDPRIPYYFYNQLAPTQTSRENNSTEYRDGGFVSIIFGSVGKDIGNAQDKSITVLGIYPVGGKYDDGSAEAVSGSSGTGAAPYRFITYADRLFIEAELMKAGVIVGDARAKLQEAMTESFNQVDYVINAFVKPAQSVPALSGTSAVTDYINAAMAWYDAHPSQQMELILTEKWISSFGSSVDQYTDYRRTGYPILFDPNNPQQAPNHFVQPPIEGNPALPGAQLPVPVQLSIQYPLSLPWPTADLNTNPNAPEQKQPATYKVFWDK